MRVGHLIESMPDLANITLTSENRKWLADIYAIVNATGDLISSVELRTAIDELSSNAEYGTVISVSRTEQAARKIQTVLYRVLAIFELQAPAPLQGSFIPVGNAFDATIAISKIMSDAESDIFIIDPYMDKKALTEFAILAPEKLTVRLLADQKNHKPCLEPASRSWIAQHGNTRPLELKLAAAGSIHDRLIITDKSTVWVLTQSFNAFATRSPASIVRFQGEVALKVAAYEDIWRVATQAFAAAA